MGGDHSGRQARVRWQRWLREPWLHFLLMGGVAFAATPAPRPEIRITAAEVSALRDEWQAAHGRAPTPGEVQALVERAVDEAVLLAEAWASGWPEHDPVVVARQARIGSFVGASDRSAAGSDVEGARALGLDRADPVIHRYLLGRMRLAIEGELGSATPRPVEPEGIHALPERLRLHHVHVGSGPDAPARAATLGVRLAHRTPEEAAALGDPFPERRTLVATREEIGRQLGPGFAAAVDATRLRRWQGPIASPFGLHWVWIDERLPARPASAQELRRQDERERLQSERARHLRRRLDSLRKRYEIRVAAPG